MRDRLQEEEEKVRARQAIITVRPGPAENVGAAALP